MHLDLVIHPLRHSRRRRPTQAHRVARARRRGSASRLGPSILWAVCTAAVVVAAIAARWAFGGGAPYPFEAVKAGGTATAAASLPSCAYADTAAARAAYGDWAITLVDTAFRLPAGYEPPDLVPVSEAGIEGTGSIRRIAVDDLRDLAAAARDDGVRLRVVSAYRSETAQARVLADAERSVGHDEALAVTARPGHSEHQLGTAIDFGAGAGGNPWEGDWGDSPEGRWLAEHAWRHGFVLSYPAASSPARTCYRYEPWHFRYVGGDVAAAIHAGGLSPREYLWRLGAR